MQTLDFAEISLLKENIPTKLFILHNPGLKMKITLVN